MDSRHFGPVPLHDVSGRITASTLKLNPRWWCWWDWWKVPRMEVTQFTIQNRAEREETRHKWEGKTWESIHRSVGSAWDRPDYKVKHYRLKVHRKKR